ncbi:MAG: hypothetical protein H6709_04890 [Kofleriaceae bacterium]|nr:hypothetical protein [Kofleriaceae bacterium]MCB9571407.1 hypothetical protein [Kofleriaceae bacterium]
MRSQTDATLELEPAPRLERLESSLASLVLEQLLERTEVRVASRMLDGHVPALGVTIGAVERVALAPGLVVEGLSELATLAVSCFIDRGFLAVVRPNRRPVFVLPLPAIEPGLDEVTLMCRQLDEERLRKQVLEAAERFVAAAERRLARFGLAAEVRLTEGALIGEPACVNALLPAARWQPV